MNTHTYKKLMWHGRLGNQLWQIASTFGRARRAGGYAYFNPNWEYREFFSVPDALFGVDFVNADFDYSAPDKGYVDYMQRFEEFAEFEDHVRTMMQPSEAGIQGVMSRWGELYDMDNKIALHVRRGDYVKHAKLFPAPTMNYYFGALGRALSELPNESGRVLVFSDDIPWCRKQFSSEFEYIEGVTRPVEVHARKGKPEDQYDLFLMASCDKHIIANSSYSWWGAFTSMKDKSPFYPSVWFGPQIPEYPVWRKMIPEGWREQPC